MKIQKKQNGRYSILRVPSDRTRYSAVGGYTPARLKAIMDAANTGDIEQLCICAREILERNWDVIGAMEQRSGALCGCEWNIRPGDDTPAAAGAARAFEKALLGAGRVNGLDTFYDFLQNAMDAVVTPFSASQIVWGEGGTLDGFKNLEPWHFTLRDGFVPRLVTDEYPGGMPEEMQAGGFIFHRFRKTADPARSGKIRVLAWLHCFQNWPIKDLFSFIERFGMPFVVAKVDQKTWDNERDVLHHLIRNFGPNGGGVFTQSTELQLLNAANTGGDNVYFRTLEFTRNAIYTLLVGQLASSSDAAGMSNGDAQSAVRQDILEADARALESTIYAQLSVPWTMFQFGPGVAPPEIHFQVEPPEDKASFANMVATLSGAGFKADARELSDYFGIKLTYEPPAPAPDGFAMAAEHAQPGEPHLKKAIEEWLGPMADDIAECAELPDDELDRRLRSGRIAEAGDSGGIERMMEDDLKEAFR